jgi:hypothetical protein
MTDEPLDVRRVAKKLREMLAVTDTPDRPPPGAAGQRSPRGSCSGDEVWISQPDRKKA